MKKIYRKLTKEQRERGVIFSSKLQGGQVEHEVLSTQDDKQEMIARLKDDKFFNDSHFTANIIRE